MVHESRKQRVPRDDVPVTRIIEQLHRVRELPVTDHRGEEGVHQEDIGLKAKAHGESVQLPRTASARGTDDERTNSPAPWL